MRDKRGRVNLNVREYIYFQNQAWDLDEGQEKEKELEWEREWKFELWKMR